jgi:proline-specific peptidase
VCHPGGPGFSSIYLSDLAGLGDTFTLVLLDPRGTGGSTAPDDARAYTTADYVADVEELRRHLGEDRLNVFGHSHGGVVATAYAAEHPERVRRVVVADSLARLQPDEMDEIMLRRRNEPWYEDARLALEQESAGEYENDAELAEITRRFWPMYFARFDDRAQRYVDECIAPERPNPEALRVFNDGLGEWDMRPDLARIATPTLVITGADDVIMPPANSILLATRIHGAYLEMLKNTGHGFFWEVPGDVAALLHKFFHAI